MGRLLILGLGNVLCGDDGLGVAAANEIRRSFETPASVRVMDGGTLGLSLLGAFEEGDDAILLDAVAAGERPGSLVRLEGEEAMGAARCALSCHQVGVADLLEALRLVGREPERLILLGLVPASTEVGLAFSPEVDASLAGLVEAAVEEARRLGHELHRPRAEPC